MSHATGEWEQSLIISAGRGNGVRLEDPVVSSEGYLVGQVTKVTRSSSEVTLLTDSTSSVTALNVATDAVGVLEIGEGPDRPFELNRVLKEKVVERGDIISTARRFGRLGSIYPAGRPDHQYRPAASTTNTAVIRRHVAMIDPALSSSGSRNG